MSPEDMVLLQQLVQMGYPPELALQVVQAQGQGRFSPDPMTGGQQNLGVGGPNTFPVEPGPAPWLNNPAYNQMGDTFGSQTYGFGFDGDPDTRYKEDGTSMPGYLTRPRPVPLAGPFAGGDDRGSLASFMHQAQAFRPDAGLGSMNPGAEFGMPQGTVAPPPMPERAATPGFIPPSFPPYMSSGLPLGAGTGGTADIGDPPAFAGFAGDKERSMARPDKPNNAAMIASDLMRGAQKALPAQAAAPAQRNAFGNNPKAVENRDSRPQPKTQPAEKQVRRAARTNDPWKGNSTLTKSNKKPTRY